MINKIKNAAGLLRSEYKDSWMKRVRQYLLLAGLMSFVFVMISFPIIYSNAATGPYQTAEYDFRATGNFNDSAYDVVEKNSESAVTVLNGAEIPVKNKDKNTRTSLFYVDDMNKSSKLLPVNNKMLIEGEFKPNHAVISKGIADELSLSIGESILIEINGYSEQLPVSGIAQSGLLDNVVVADRPESIDNEMKYTSIYAQCNGECTGINNIENENVSTITRSQEIQMQEEKVDQFTDSPVVKITSIGGLLLYILVFVRSTINRVEDRKKLYGTLRSLGANRSLPFVHLFLENVLLLVVTTAIGFGLAVVYFKQVMGIYVSTNSLIQTLATALSLNLLIISGVTGVFIYLLSKQNIAEQLEG